MPTKISLIMVPKTVEKTGRRPLRVCACRSNDEPAFSAAFVGEPYVDTVRREVAYGSFGPFDGDNGPSIEILLQAEIGNRPGRVQAIEIDMRERKATAIFVN